MKKLQLLTLAAMLILQNQLYADDVSDEIRQQVVQENKLPLHDIIKDQKHSTDQKLAMIQEILDQKQVDINAKDSTGRTALNLATFYNADPLIAKILIDAGADINEPDTFNETPLHNAISKQELVIAAMLLKKGANKRFENDQNITPLDLARSPETIALLGLEEDVVAV